MARGTVLFSVLILGLSLLHPSSCDKSTENLPQSESLVQDESKNEAAKPQPPFWIRPERMDRRVYAEPLHKTVRIFLFEIMFVKLLGIWAFACSLGIRNAFRIRLTRPEAAGIQKLGRQNFAFEIGKMGTA